MGRPTVARKSEVFFVLACPALLRQGFGAQPSHFSLDLLFILIPLVLAVPTVARKSEGWWS